ncbi:MAG TPA: hypothetical protein VGJ06_07670 [Candidatus Acidoferrum sp.]|jgi:hypothetical protein
MSTIARIVLNSAAALIVFGGLYDLLTPKLPPNLAAICGDNDRARKLVRELLRALGGSLVAVGASVAVLVNTSTPETHHRTLLLILLLVVPAEGVNSYSMRKVGSPYYIPLVFLLLTVLGVALAWHV